MLGKGCMLLFFEAGASLLVGSACARSVTDPLLSSPAFRLPLLALLPSSSSGT